MKKPNTAFAAVVALATLPGAALAGPAFTVVAGSGCGKFPGHATAVVGLSFHA